MTDEVRHNPYWHGEAPRAPQQGSLEGLSTKKTMLVLVVVVGCFAVLWPKLFYPMLVSNANSHIKPGPVDKTAGCCDVISELDVDTIKILAELCSTIIDHQGEKPLGPKEIVFQCRKSVLETCGIDISAALQDRISLGHSAKQILEEVRSLNGSLCLKYNFGVSPWRLGVPHRVNINLDPANSIRQERPSHLRPGMVHPAFKERGRAIPEAEPSVSPKRTGPPPRIVEGRPGPIPGMRPTLGGPGHVVPPSKQTSYGFMGVLMPIYTVGFVIFFSYTIMKLVFKRKPDAYAGASLYPPCESDEHFQKDVFDTNKHYFNRPNRDQSKIGDDELDQLRKRLRETELAMERIVRQMAQAPLATQDEIKPNGLLPKEEDQGSVTVMAMETTASCENGKKWSRPDSPALPHPHPAPPKEPSPPPQQIFLEGALPPQSQILVADSATEAQKATEDDSPVVLAGKMTLSVISLDSETGTEDSSASGGKTTESPEDERRSSSNVSDEFEKINAADLEDQIDSIIREAGTLALTEETRFNLVEKLDEAPSINENDILEEIKNQFNLEDDLLQALRENEPESKLDLPVTDIIKEFLSKEENALFEQEPQIIAAAEEQEPTRENNDASEDCKSEIANIKEDAVNVQLDMPIHEDATDNSDDITTTNEDRKSELAEGKEDTVTLQEKELSEKVMAENSDKIIAASDDSKPEIANVKEDPLQQVAAENSDEIITANEDRKTEIANLSEEPPQEAATGDGDKIIVASEERKPDIADVIEETVMSQLEQSTLDLAEDEASLVVAKTEQILEDEEASASFKLEEPTPTEEGQEPNQPLIESNVDDAKESNSVRNMADLLLQGLLVKDDVDEEAPNEEDNVEYDDQSGNEDLEVDEVREPSAERRLNGDGPSPNSETAAENEIYDNEFDDDEDEEIEEIIEYVDNTDDEGEEIIEINGNESANHNENGGN